MFHTLLFSNNLLLFFIEVTLSSTTDCLLVYMWSELESIRTLGNGSMHNRYLISGFPPYDIRLPAADSQPSIIIIMEIRERVRIDCDVSTFEDCWSMC